jgi:hypothetical protein
MSIKSDMQLLAKGWKDVKWYVCLVAVAWLVVVLAAVNVHGEFHLNTDIYRLNNNSGAVYIPQQQAPVNYGVICPACPNNCEAVFTGHTCTDSYGQYWKAYRCMCCGYTFWHR